MSGSPRVMRSVRVTQRLLPVQFLSRTDSPPAAQRTERPSVQSVHLPFQGEWTCLDTWTPFLSWCPVDTRLDTLWTDFDAAWLDVLNAGVTDDQEALVDLVLAEAAARQKADDGGVLEVRAALDQTA